MARKQNDTTQTAPVNSQPAPAFTAQDAHNVLVFLDRVQTRGVQEAQVLALLAHKLRTIRGESAAQSPQTAQESDG